MSASQPRLIALAAGGGVAALGVIALVIGLVHTLSSSSSAPPVAAPDDNTQHADIANAGMNAPGTAELRKLGCDPAIVIDMATLLGGASAVRPGEPRYVVTCDVPGKDAPTCERVAAAYFAAPGITAGGVVNVRVSRPGASAPLCARRYAPSGADLGT